MVVSVEGGGAVVLVVKVAFFFVVMACALGSAEGPDFLSLATRLENSSISYTKLTDKSAREQSARFLTSLDKALGALEGALPQESEEAFFLEDVRRELLSEKPNLETLENSYRAMCNDLDQPVDFAASKAWRDIRTALKSITTMHRARSESNGITELQRRVREIAQDLRQLSNVLDEKNERLIFQRLSENYRWCAIRGQALDALSGVRGLFQRPNQVMAIHERFLARKLNGTLPNQNMPVHEVNQGFTITGQGEGTGSYIGSFFPNSSMGEIRVLLSGQANASALQASRNRLTVHLGSSSSISGHVSFLVDEKLNLVPGSRAVSVETKTEVHGANISTRKLFPNRTRERRILNGRVRESIAVRVAESNTPQMDSQTSDKLEKEISEKISSEIESQLNSGEFNQKLESFKKLAREQFVFPLDRQDLNPKISLRTDHQNLIVQSHFGPTDELTSFSTPPVGETAGFNSDISGYVHESLFNQFSRFLEGVKVEEQSFRELFFTQLGLKVPKEFDITGENPAWLTLADVDPFEVRLEAGEFIATFRLKAFKAEKKVYKTNPIAIQVRYRPSIAVDENGVRGGVQLDRDSEIEIITDLEEEKLAFLAIADRFFVKRAISQGISVDDELKLEKPMGRFLANRVAVARGWLTVGWKNQGE